MAQYIKENVFQRKNNYTVLEKKIQDFEQVGYGKYFRKIQKNRYPCIITKSLLILLAVYEGFYLEMGRSIPFLLQGLTILLVIFCFLEAPHSISKTFNDPVFLWWFGFGIYSFLSALLFVGITNNLLNGIYKYFSFLLVCFCASCVTFETKKIDWLFASVILVTILSCYQVMFHGVSWRNSGYTVVTMGIENNPNNLGLTMSIGLSVLLYPYKKKKSWLWIICIIISLFVYTVIIYAGSRSGLLCSLVVVFFSTIAIFRYVFKNSKHIILSTVVLIICIVSIVYFGLNYFNSIGSHNTGFDRLQNEFKSDAYNGRGNLYSIGINLFTNNLFTGVGYGNFRNYANGFFSHSTYIELLACSGLCGFVLFEIPFVRMIIKNIRMIGGEKSKGIGYWISMLSLFFVSGFFGIVYYELFFMLILYMCLSDSRCSTMERKE